MFDLETEKKSLKLCSLVIDWLFEEFPVKFIQNEGNEFMLKILNKGYQLGCANRDLALF